MLTPLILCPVFYSLEWQWSMSWLILLLPLTAFSLAVGGMFLGLALENQDLLNLVSTIGTCLIFLASPVFIPLEALPLPLQILSFLLPPSYAADAMRHAFAATIGWEFYADLIMLLFFAGVSSIGIHKFLRWRM
jgi:ABC-2 type transport system permease protein